MITKIGKHTGCTHIHDNDGIYDRHTLPYYGNIDWESVMKAFAETGYEGNLNYEAGLFVNNVPVCMRKESAIYGELMLTSEDLSKASESIASCVSNGGIFVAGIRAGA